MSPRRDYEDDGGSKHPNFNFNKSRRHRSDSDEDYKRRKRSRRGRDVESVSSDDDDFIMDKDQRKTFVSKVYAILSGYLIFAFAVVFGISFSEEAREFCHDYFWIAYIFMILSTIIYLVLVCCPSVARSFPINFILLTIHNIFFSGMVGWIASAYDFKVVWMAFLATGVITVLISLFAKFAPCDVTGCGLFFCIAFLAMAVFCLIATIVVMVMKIHAPILWLVIAGIMVGLLTFYLMFVTQLILGGRRGEFDTDDVVLAVIVLFTTIMDIFIYLLMLIAGIGGSDD